MENIRKQADTNSDDNEKFLPRSVLKQSTNKATLQIKPRQITSVALKQVKQPSKSSEMKTFNKQNTLANKKENIQRFLPKQLEATKKMILFKPNDIKKCINVSLKVKKFRKNFKNQTKRLLFRHKNNVIRSREIRETRRKMSSLSCFLVLVYS